MSVTDVLNKLEIQKKETERAIDLIRKYSEIFSQTRNIIYERATQLTDVEDELRKLGYRQDAVKLREWRLSLGLRMRRGRRPSASREGAPAENTLVYDGVKKLVDEIAAKGSAVSSSMLLERLGVPPTSRNKAMANSLMERLIASGDYKNMPIKYGQYDFNIIMPAGMHLPYAPRGVEPAIMSKFIEAVENHACSYGEVVYKDVAHKFRKFINGAHVKSTGYLRAAFNLACIFLESRGKLRRSEQRGRWTYRQ